MTCFFIGLAFLSTLTSVHLLSCISMNNEECKVRLQIVNVNGDNPVFFPYSVKTSKCSGSCNNINNPLAKLCVPVVVKNLNVKVFNLVLGTNETRRTEWDKYAWKWHVNVDSNKVFVMINNVGIMINASVNAKNWLIKAYAIKNLFGILVIVSANVIIPVILVSI